MNHYPLSTLRKKLHSGKVNPFIVDNSSGEIATKQSSPGVSLVRSVVKFALTIATVAAISAILLTPLLQHYKQEAKITEMKGELRNNKAAVASEEELVKLGASRRFDKTTNLTFMYLHIGKGSIEKELALISKLLDVQEVTVDKENVIVVFLSAEQ